MIGSAYMKSAKSAQPPVSKFSMFTDAIKEAGNYSYIGATGGAAIGGAYGAMSDSQTIGSGMLGGAILGGAGGLAKGASKYLSGASKASGAPTADFFSKQGAKDAWSGNQAGALGVAGAAYGMND